MDGAPPAPFGRSAAPDPDPETRLFGACAFPSGPCRHRPRRGFRLHGSGKPRPLFSLLPGAERRFRRSAFRLPALPDGALGPRRLQERSAGLPDVPGEPGPPQRPGLSGADPDLRRPAGSPGDPCRRDPGRRGRCRSRGIPGRTGPGRCRNCRGDPSRGNGSHINGSSLRPGRKRRRPLRPPSSSLRASLQASSPLHQRSSSLLP